MAPPIRSPVGIPPGRCPMIEPDSTITEYYGVLVSWLVLQVSAVTVERTLSTRPEATPHGPLPLHLKEIVTGFHSSLGRMVLQR